METLAAEYANPVHGWEQRSSSCRSGSAESCICLCYAHVPSDSNYARQKTRTKKSRFLNKMPSGPDCIRRDNGTAGNAAFLLRSRVCQIGKSPKKHAVGQSAHLLLAWGFDWGFFGTWSLFFWQRPCFVYSPLLGYSLWFSLTHVMLCQLLFCSAAAALKIASACFGSTSNLWKLTEKKAPVSGWATYDFAACAVHRAWPLEMHHWKFKI